MLDCPNEQEACTKCADEPDTAGMMSEQQQLGKANEPNADCCCASSTTCTTDDAEATAETSEQLPVELSWDDIRRRLRLKDGDIEGHFLGLFEDRYDIDSPISAMMHIKAFLSEYLIREFDYRRFSISIGRVSECDAQDQRQWKSYVAQHLAEDMRTAASLMLRMAVLIAQAFDLRSSDWQDINHACGQAVRASPLCYELQRSLPGALDDARAMRFLPVLGEMPECSADLNPWESKEGQALFEGAHGIEWATIEMLTQKDESPTCAFSGTFAVMEITPMEDMTFVRLQTLSVTGDKPSSTLPLKHLQPLDVILWELDSQRGKLLLPGFVLHAEWYELPSEVCFMSSLVSVSPEWAVASN